MNRYVGVILYKGLVGEIRVFDAKVGAIDYLMERRRLFGLEDTSGSLVWDVIDQLPIAIDNPDPSSSKCIEKKT
jgi:hypothetical protein